MLALNEQVDTTASLPVKQDKNNYQLDKEAKKLERQRKRRMEEIEEQIEALETVIDANDQLLCDPNVYQDHEKVMEITNETDGAKAKLEELMEEWTLLAEED